MGQLVDSVHLNVDSPSYYVRRPRIWRLGLGLLCFPLGFSLFWIVSIGNYWSAIHLGAPQYWGGLIILMGVYFVVLAAVSDLLRVYEVSFNKQGMYLSWSHVPKLFAERIKKQKSFQWNEIKEFQWIESNNENDLRQVMEIQFKEKIGIRKKHIKVQISDDRNPEHCEKLIALLPEDIILPEWIHAIRKLRKKSHQSREGLFDNLPMHL